MSTMLFLIEFSLVILSTLWALTYYAFHRSSARFKAETIQVSGTVVGSKLVTGSKQLDQFYPIVEFQDQQKNTVREVTHSYTGGKFNGTPDVANGTQVTVYYNPKNPASAHLVPLPGGISFSNDTNSWGCAFLIISLIVTIAMGLGLWSVR